MDLTRTTFDISYFKKLWPWSPGPGHSGSWNWYYL